MPDSPFKLLVPYGPGDKDIFFGRDAEIFALYNLLQQTRLVLIYGASGTGKTSLIQAGLPKVFKLTDWLRVSVRRRDNINQTLRLELQRMMDQTSSSTDLLGAIRSVYESRWIPVYLVFDQFEEIFTLGNHDERLDFFRDLNAIMAANLPCKVILSMREEYIGHLYDYEALVPELFEKRFRVEPMKDETVRQVINQMCENFNIDLESEKNTPGLILDQVKEGKQAAHLPYLQIYLHYLYEEAMTTLRRRKFTQAGIEAVGKLGNVLKRFIETKVAEAGEFLRNEGAPDNFASRLLDEFSTDEGTKQSFKAPDLAKRLKVGINLVQKALLYFSDTAKLLRADEDDVERYEPVHDVVAKQIHELRSVEDKEFKAFARQIEGDYERWCGENKSNNRLLTESDLAKAELYQQRWSKRDEYRHWEGFIEKSWTYRNRQKKLDRRRLIFVSGVAVIAVLASILALIANQQAQKEKKEADEARIAADRLKTEALNQRNFAIDNLKLYKKAELASQLVDVETYIKSNDMQEAAQTFELAEKTRKEYFPDDADLRAQMEKLKKRIVQ